MDWPDPLMLSRVQFALTTMFHIFWPLLSIGLSLYIVVMEGLWLLGRGEVFYRQAHFWTKPFLLSFGLGVASGLPLEFQFGTNWANFCLVSGGFFGNILGFEAAMSFMLEAAFLGIMIFGRRRVSRGMHFFATVMVAFGASLSAFWIMVASAWMQTPAGVQFEGGRAMIIDYFAAVFNPSWFYSFSHMWMACFETTLLLIGGISAWCILRKRQTEFFLLSFKMALAISLIVAPLQILLGDMSGRGVATYQPAKLAAMESHWQTNPPGQGASMAIAAWPDPENSRNAWEVRLPNLLSLITTRTLTGTVVGLTEFEPKDRPPVAVTFWSFRLMIALGTLMLTIVIWGAFQWRRGRLSPKLAHTNKWLLRMWIVMIPTGFIATDLGWVVREVGRQPWVIYNIMRTSDGVSNLESLPPTISLLVYAAIYLLLPVMFIYFTRRLVIKGPDLTSDIPQPPVRIKGDPV